MLFGGGLLEVLCEIMAYHAPHPPELLQHYPSEEYRTRIHTLGQCALVSRVWSYAVSCYRFRHPAIVFRDPIYSSNGRTLRDFVLFLTRDQATIPSFHFRSLILHNDNFQLSTAFHAGGMRAASDVKFSACLMEFHAVVSVMPLLSTLKLCYFTISDLAQAPILEYQPEFDNITHFTYACRSEISRGSRMRYVELCMLLSCFRSLRELVLDDIDIDAAAVGGAGLPTMHRLEKLVIHRCDDISALAAGLLIQVANGDLPHLHFLELGYITPSNKLICQQLIAALAPRLTDLILGHHYANALSDYLTTLSFPLEFQQCPLLTNLRIVLDVSDPDTPSPAEAFEHLALMLTSAAAPIDTVREVTVEYGEAPATVAHGDECNVGVLLGASTTCKQRTDTTLMRHFRALQVVRFVPMREFDFAVFSEVDQRIIRDAFRGLDLKGLLKF